MEKFHRAVGRVLDLFSAGHPCVCAWSSGKDSSCLLVVVLEAMQRSVAAGGNPYLIVTHSDTGIENPEIHNFAQAEMIKIRAFAARHNLRVEVAQAQPSLGAGWAVRVISGRALPAFPGGNSDCSTDWKITPMRRLRKQIFAGLKESFDSEAITVIGTRFDESAERNRRMTERGESWEVPIRNKDGDLVLSAIADWTTDDVWEMVGLVRAGAVTSYSDFDDLFRLYADGGGTSCAVVSDAIMEENRKKSSGCGARFGCHMCTRVKADKSLENMISGDEARYGYMRPLNALREYIMASHFDLEGRRMWIGRSIIDGHIAIRPDTYSPSYCLELLRLVLTIDAREREAADQLGIAPRFQIIGLRELVAIDAIWSLQGYAKPHQAIREWVDVQQGVRHDIPANPRWHKQPSSMPEPRWYPVGDDWDEGELYFSGLRDATAEMVSGESGCMGTRTLSSGVTVMDMEEGVEFDVDDEGVALVFALELDRLLEVNVRSSANFGLTAGYRYWVQMGVLEMPTRQMGIHDEILRRTAFKERHGLAGANADLDDILSRSISDATLRRRQAMVVAEHPAARQRRLQEEAIRRRDEARWPLTQKRFNVRELMANWSPAVPWRQLFREGAIGGRLPRQRSGARFLVLRHLVSLYDLLAFLLEHPDYLRLVAEHRRRNRKILRKAEGRRKKRAAPATAVVPAIQEVLPLAA